jgi:hypothetical protein
MGYGGSVSGMSEWTTPLDELRWHWGDAYLISYLGHYRWMAKRRDNRETLTAEDPRELRDLIVADYTARPVSRQVAGADDWPPAPSCRSPLE